MKTNKFLPGSILSFLVVLLFSCGKDKVNPYCSGDRPTKMAIVFTQTTYTPQEGVFAPLEIGDTAFEYSVIGVAANIPAIYLTWKVANDSRTFTDQQKFGLSFPQAGKYPIQLIVDWYDSCANLPHRDTVKRDLVIVPRSDAAYANHKLLGSYLGSNTDNVKDTFTIDFRYFPRPPGYSPNQLPDEFGTITVRNLPKNHKQTLEIRENGGWILSTIPDGGTRLYAEQSFLFGAPITGISLRGSTFIKTDGKTLVFNYSYIDSAAQTNFIIYKTFVGTKK